MNETSSLDDKEDAVEMEPEKDVEKSSDDDIKEVKKTYNIIPELNETEITQKTIKEILENDDKINLDILI